MKSDSPIDYLFAPDHTPEWSDWTSTGIHVTRMVIGTQGSSMDLGNVPDLAARFPNLKALHLLGLADLSIIPSLPPQLEILDIRNCPDLTTIPPLPETLADLVLDDLPALDSLSTRSSTIALHDVAIVKCSAIPEGQIHQLLSEILSSSRGRTLGCLDLSGCGQLTELPHELPSFARLLCNECHGLNTLPEFWPQSLTRIDLASTAIESLPEPLPEALQYLDVRACRALKTLPETWAQHSVLKTLFLSGSAVKSPPATLHGVDNENVAQKVRHYLREMDTYGRGKYNRCKILLLGNGSAGKTTLSLSLEGKDQTSHPGSTHGIRMVECPVQVKHKGQRKTVERTIWDFGGQEIYHNTHAIFLKTNAVFVVLWDGQAEQEDASSEEPWRPLRYWLDYIANYGPAGKRVAVACNWHGTGEIRPEQVSEIRQNFRESISHLDWEPALFITNAAAKTRDYAELAAWIDDNTVELAESEGTRIVSYWEIAVDLVSAWIEKGDPKELSVDDFTVDLQSLVDCAMRDGGVLSERVPEQLKEKFSAWRGRLIDLRRSTENEGFVLDEEKISQLLGFLHNAGLVYWKQDLFQRKIIISQRWALDGIYSLLSREAPLRGALKASRGRFTWDNLEDHWTDRSLDENQKKLMVSYMVEAGCCFTLIGEKERLNSAPVYVSLAHLPSMMDLGWRAFFSDHQPVQRMQVPRLHLGHWHAMLRELGRIYGRDAEYASNGFAFEVEGAQTVVVHLRIDRSGIGGTVDLYVLHPDPEKQSQIVGSMSGMIARYLPVPEDHKTTTSETNPTHSGTPLPARPGLADCSRGLENDRTHPAGPNPGTIQIFLSHAWPEKWDEKGNPINPAVYSSAVEFVEAEIAALRREVAAAHGGRQVKLYYDKKTQFDDLGKFVNEIKVCDWIVIVHSDKYWRSAWCLYEFISARIYKGEQGFLDRIMMIKLEDCRAHDLLARYQEIWRRRSESYWDLQRSRELNPGQIEDAAYPTALTRHGYEKVLGNRENVFGSWIQEALGRVHQQFPWDSNDVTRSAAIREGLRQRLLRGDGTRPADGNP